MWIKRKEKFMEERIFCIDCDLLDWIKNMSQKYRDCQIIVTISNGGVVRATCYMSDSFGLEKK